MAEIGLLRRPRPQARIRPAAIVELQIPAKRRACLGDTVIGPQIDLLLFHRAPEPLDKDVVPPGAPPSHADRNPLFLQQLREGHTGESATLIGVEISGLPCRANASFTVSRQNFVSSVIYSR